MRGGAAVNLAPAGAASRAQVLDNGDAGGEQQRVRGALGIGNVVDADRIDAHQRRLMV
jgi:hypothetical protein